MSANLALTNIKLGDSATPANNFLISVPDTADGTLTIERENGTDVMTIDATGKVTLPAGLVSDKGLPVFHCRAWCRFNGTTTGTNPPVAGGNVASITRVGPGDYSIAFSTPMPDANYSVAGLGATANGLFNNVNQSSGGFQVRHYIASTGTSNDCGLCGFMVVR